MITCPSCQNVLPDDSRFCSRCGSPIDAGELMTRASDPAAGPPIYAGALTPPSAGSGTSRSGWLTSSGGANHGRFAPGTILGNRYRVVERLGQGGMGEVYRADDLALDQAVALKFLPPAFEREPARLAQLYNEVRMARQVSHLNVCTVFDIGEADGSHFISMEYVDGEDLGSLLRRIGRLPEDKAIEMSRQICAGLAAAHQRGVLHRDLKPANVLIDSRGSVRLADFGLAGVAGQIADIRVGTPAYMAPEQLAGREVTARSDIYALGLVLYELFTGRRVFQAATIADLVRLHQDDRIQPPSAVVTALDPAIDRAVMRCLAREPDERPASAIAVSASLPGGDPLAAALAAGETPSPEMVAAASDTAAIPVSRGLVWVGAILLALVGVAALFDRVILFARIPPAKPMAVLVDRAEQIRTALGYADPPADQAWGAAIDDDALQWRRRAEPGPDGFASLGTGRPPAVVYWCRASPMLLAPRAASGEVDLGDPPSTVPGMLTLLLDGQGRLVEFNAVPPQLAEPASNDDVPAAAPDWGAVFEAADLSMDRFVSVEPRWTPRVYADRRAAWEGELPNQPGQRLRVEAGAYEGRPVFFQLIGSWSAADRMEPFQSDPTTAMLNAAGSATIPLLLIGAALLARRNLRAGRGDRRSATRVAAFVVAVDLVGWAFRAHHLPAFNDEAQAFFLACGQALLVGGLIWLTYLAIEPAVRRWWPDMLIAWSRLMGGAWRDPRVGRDVLAGVSVGVGATVLAAIFPLVAGWLGQPEPVPHLTAPMLQAGPRYWVAAFAAHVQTAVEFGLLAAFTLVLLRRVTRRQGLAVAVAALAFGPLAARGLFESGTLWLDLGFAVLLTTIMFGTMLRVGLVGVIAAFTPHLILLDSPVTLRLSTWYAGPAMAATAVVVAMTAYGYWAARAGEPLFGHADM